MFAYQHECALHINTQFASARRSQYQAALAGSIHCALRRAYHVYEKAIIAA